MRLTFTVLALLCMSNSAWADKTVTHGSCSFLFKDGEKGAVYTSWLALDGTAAVIGYSGVEKHIFDRLCKWKPRSTFIITGEYIDATNGYDLRSSPKGHPEFDVQSGNCRFTLSHGKEGSKYFVYDTKASCNQSTPKTRKGVDQIIPQAVSGAFSVICKDGSAGTLTQSSPPVWCAATLDGERNRCSGETSRRAMAEWMCR